MIETRRKGSNERGLVRRDFEGKEAYIGANRNNVGKTNSLTLLCRERLLKSKETKFKGAKGKVGLAVTQPLLKRDKERFLSTGEKTRVIGDRESSTSLPVGNDKMLQMAHKIRQQAQRIMSLEQAFNKGQRKDQYDLVLQLTLLSEENNLLKQKISVLEGGLCTLKGAADHETCRANELESQLSILQANTAEDIIGNSDVFKLSSDRRSIAQPLTGLNGETQSLVDELIQYKMRADEKIVQTTLETEQLRAEVHIK